MLVKTVSASSYGTYDFCEWKYFLRYILKFDDPSGPSALLGKIVHNTFQRYSKSVIDKSPLKIKLFDEIWSESIDDAKKMDSENAFEKITNGTIKNMKKTSLEFITKSEYSPLKGNTICVEKYFGLPLKNIDEIKGLGYIDRVDKVDDSTINIIDYKTGQRKSFSTKAIKSKGKKEIDDLYDDIQLRIYHMVARELWPQYPNVLVTLIFLTDGGPMTVPFCDDDIPKTISLLSKKIIEIKNNNDPKLNRGFWCKNICFYGKSGICEHVKNEADELGLSFVQDKYQVINGNRKSRN